MKPCTLKLNMAMSALKLKIRWIEHMLTIDITIKTDPSIMFLRNFCPVKDTGRKYILLKLTCSV